jgi:predicted DNA-binding protein (MmcQ/YjbR family)
MNKKHWNTVLLDGSVSDKEVFSWIDHSYELITGKH